MNIAICDDEQQVTEQVKNILEMLQIKYDVELKIFQFCDAEDFKYDIEEGTQFDIVFMDPPYNHLFEKDVLNYLKESNLISNESIIIVEASNETEFDYLEDMGYKIIKEKVYKTNKHVFIQLCGE